MNLWCPLPPPYWFLPILLNKCTGINSLLSPRSPPLCQTRRDISAVFGHIQSLPVRDLLLSQLQAHEHRAAGKPQVGVKVD